MNTTKIIREILSSLVLVVITFVFLGIGTTITLNHDTYTKIASAQKPSQKIAATMEKASAESIALRSNHNRLIN